VRLIVTDTATAARTIADSLASGKAGPERSHGIETPSFPGGRAIGLGGPLHEVAAGPGRGHPADRPLVWSLRRRAVARALRASAPAVDTVEAATADDSAGELRALQAVEILGEVEPRLWRGARRAGSPGRPLDEPRAESAAAAQEVDALWACALAPFGAGLGLLAPLALAGGDGADALPVLAAEGLVWGDPALPSGAGALALERLEERAPALLSPATALRVGEWLGSVADGTLGRPRALGRVRDLLRDALPAEGLGPPPPSFAEGRTLGACPECGGPMRPRVSGGRRTLGCDACGLRYPLPGRGALLATPDAACAACGAPLLRLDGGPARCVDRTGCPDAA
jgi:hypothetical protein